MKRRTQSSRRMVRNIIVLSVLLEKYDLDPAAKAAAATILASKLGADSGLKVHVGDEIKADEPLAKSSDAEIVQSNGLRNRKQAQARTSSSGSSATQIATGLSDEAGANSQEASLRSHKVVEHYKGSGTNDGWIARIAALLMGEDPSQCYALVVCGNCRMHNGLAHEEDFLYITYYCPRCHALNTSSQSGDRDLGASSGGATPLALVEDANLTLDAVSESEVESSTIIQELPARKSAEKERTAEAC